MGERVEGKDLRMRWQVAFRCPAAAIWVTLGVAAVVAAQEVAPPSGDQDPRALPISLRAHGTPVGEVVRMLKEQMRVPLKVESGLAADRVVVYCRNRPVGQAMTGLVKLLNGRWELAPGGDLRNATLAPVPSARREEIERLRTGFNAACAPWLNVAARARAQALAELKPRTSSGRGAAAEIDLLLRRTGKVPVPGLQLLSSLSQGQREQLLLSGFLYLPFASMDGRQQGLMRLFLKEKGMKEQEALAHLQNAGPLFYAETDPSTLTKAHFVMWFDGSFRTLTEQPPVTLHSRSGGTARPVRARPYPVSGGSRLDYTAVERQVLPRDFRFNPEQEYTWPDILEALSHTTPFALYSDCFQASEDVKPVAGRTLPQANLPAERTVAGLLDVLCQRYRRVWWVEDGAIYLRDREWFFRRLYEVPPAVEQSLEQHLTRHGTLPPAGLALLGRLTSRQIEGWSLASVMKAATPVGARGSFWGRKAQPYLELYAKLPLVSQGEAQSESGLPFNRMPPAAKAAYMRNLLITEGTEVMEKFPDVYLRIRQTSTPISAGKRQLGRLTLMLTYAPDARFLARFQILFPLPEGTPHAGAPPG